MSSDELETDVVVVGAGNAAACAAVAAHEQGARVLMLEAAPEDQRGGNSTYTGGMFRVVYNGVEDVRQLIPDLTDAELANIELDTYTQEQYFDDMGRLTQYRADPDLTEVMIRQSFDTASWMQSKGVRFQLAYGVHGFKHNNRFKFWGGGAVQIWGGGAELVKAWHARLQRENIPVLYETPALSLLHDDDGVKGVLAKREGKTTRILAKAVVLACGGFESNAEMRTRYLGPGWDLAKVRGTKYNNGGGINMALAIGDLTVGDSFQKHQYPFCIYINANGERFVDEGADFHTFTYAKYGAEVLKQPGQFAWQVFDQKTTHLLREDYRIKRITKAQANTFEELAQKLEGVNARKFLETVNAYNAAPRPDVPFDPNILDGLCTHGLAINKSNWAQPLDKPPYHAYGVTCGITFTFGGLMINTRSEVRDTAERSIPGLYAAGELVGGLYYHNYGSGSGLISGAVFGRIAGREAAGRAKAK